MESNKLPHSIIGAVLATVLTVLNWMTVHGLTILSVACGIAALTASIYSARASRETIKYRQKQQEALTSLPNKEPETDL